MTKIFIIGLPRTGTTSFCVEMLELGYSVAHTAYSEECMITAEVIADTPVFCDYQTLDKFYPNARFIYLQRSLDLWLPSIRQLLQRMFVNLTRFDGGFNPILKRCYKSTFSTASHPLSLENIAQDDFLIECYKQHQQGIENYFRGRGDDLLVINISEPDSYKSLLNFLKLDKPIKHFIKLNVGGKVIAWNKVRDPLKVDSNLKSNNFENKILNNNNLENKNHKFLQSISA